MVRGLPAAGVLFLALGCAAESEVSGTVKVGGADLDSGAILFVPVDGKTGTAGGEIKQGRYSVKVPVGQMKVSISAPKVVGQKKVYNTPNSPVMPVTAEALPARYNEKTELTLDVKPGRNTKDWALDGK
jgi:hypothetical protein